MTDGGPAIADCSQAGAHRLDPGIDRLEGPDGMRVITFILLSCLVTSVPTRAADSPYLYGIHWWGHWQGQPIDNTPCQLFDCQTYGGWDVETVLTHSDGHWKPSFFVPLYQELTGNKNMSIITRIDYKWGETVPTPTGPDHATWPDSCVSAVNTLSNYCHIWQIGNEANVTWEATNWPETRIYPAQYAEIYRNVRNAIHTSANPSPTGEHIVCIAAPSPGEPGGPRWMSGTQWLGEVLDAIPDDEIDGVGIHSYGGTVSGFRSSYSALLAELTSRGLHNVPVYMTEWNRAATPGSASAEAAAAQFCRDAFADVHNWNQTPGNHNIVCLAWFIYDADQQAGGVWDKYSIEYWRTDGNPLGDPGDLFTAFRLAVDQHYPAGATGNPGYLGGRPISLGATAVTADSTGGAGSEPDKAIDNSLQTRWISADSPGPHWLQIDLGLLAPLTGISLYHAGSGGGLAAQNTIAFTVESAPSATGPWATDFTGHNALQENVSTFTYTTPKSIRHLRLHITDPGHDARARICEFEVRSEETITAAMPAGTNVAPQSSQAVASSEFSPAYGADKAIDGVVSEASKWTSANVTPPHTLTLDLGAPRPASGFVLRQPSAAGEGSHFNVARFSFQSARSMAGPWYTESVGANDGSEDSDARAFVSPKELRYVRLRIDDPGADNYARVPEFEVWMATGLIANFIGNPTTGRAPLPVAFTDASFGNVTTWNWDFGDGEWSTDQNPVHVYQNVGTHTVALTVQGPDGTDIETKADYIVIEPIPADFDADGDVDMGDFGHLQSCLTGPGIAQENPECVNARLDSDNDVDQDDVSVLRDCLSGANVLPDPDCVD